MRRRTILLPAFLALFLLAPAVRAEEPGADPDLDAMRTAVEALMKDAEDVRGLDFAHEFAKRLFTPDELRKLAMEMLDKELPPAVRGRMSALDARLGFFPAGTDLADVITEFLAVGAAGFYDPETRTLQIQRGFSLDGSKPIILHELIHALEDQHFDLKALQEGVGLDTDRGLGLSGVVEGSATLFMTVYIQKNIAAAMAMMRDVMKQQQEQEEMMARLPVVLTAQVGLFPYLSGQKFVMQATGGDPAKVSALYSDVPVSSEQILHPEKYGDRGDYPHRVSIGDLSGAMPDGWTMEHEDTLGELSVAVLLNEFAGGTNAEKLSRIQGGMFNPGLNFTGTTKTASEGWDGDRVYGWFGPDGQVGYVWASVWDTPQDAREFAEAWEAGLPYKWNVMKLAPKTAHVEVRGDRVLIVEGFPAEKMAGIAKAAWDRAVFVPSPRDPKDVAALRARVEERRRAGVALPVEK